MKILNSGDLFYLKGILLTGQGNDISMFFRQEHLYSISRSLNSSDYYKNVTLLLCFDTNDQAKINFDTLKGFYLDSTLSIEYEVTNHIITFIGDHDYSVEVKSYHEALHGQFTEDWIERYNFLSNWILDNERHTSSYYDLIKTIELMTQKFTIDNQRDKSIWEFGSQILALIKENAREQKMQLKVDLLTEINKKLTRLEQKINNLT